MTGWPNSDDTCREVSRTTGGRCFLKFSMGKDSIAALVQCRKFFSDITLVYEMIWPLRLVEESLAYYREVLSERLIVVPAVCAYSWLSGLMYASPRVGFILDEFTFPKYQPVIQNVWACQEAGVDYEKTWFAVGTRAADSAIRRIAFSKYGPIRRDRSFYPVWDWSIDDVRASIRESGIKLPADYRMFGRSWEGLNAEYTRELAKHYPDDLEALKVFFPLLEVDIKRFEFRKAYWERREADGSV